MNKHTCTCKGCGQSGILLRGWVCTRPACGLFNSEEKNPRPACRGCDAAKPQTATEKRDQAIVKAYWEDPEARIPDVARKFRMSRSRIGQILKEHEARVKDRAPQRKARRP